MGSSPKPAVNVVNRRVNWCSRMAGLVASGFAEFENFQMKGRVQRIHHQHDGADRFETHRPEKLK